MRVKILYVILVIIGLTLMINGAVGILQRDKQQDEQIKQLEQSLAEQIQEVKVYRGILETYQTEGIINE